jgi:hypothetical protein
VLLGEAKWSRSADASALVRVLERKAAALPGVTDTPIFAVCAREGLRNMPSGAFTVTAADIAALPSLQVALEDACAPLRIDLVPLQRVDGLFQFAAVDGERVFAEDVDRADLYELVVLRKAAELLPRQRAIEHGLFGIATS